MRKVWVIACREYAAAVRTKAFVFSIVMMPVLWGASIGLQVLMKKAEDQTTKKVLVVDRTPGQRIKPALDAALEFRNRVLIYDPETHEQVRPKYEFVYVEPSSALSPLRLVRTPGLGRDRMPAGHPPPPPPPPAAS